LLTSSLTLAAAAGVEFVGGKAPAFAQTRTLHVLEWSSFVPAADVIRDQQAAEFGKQAGVKVTIEHINANDLLPGHGRDRRSQGARYPAVAE
jgi:ABC-type glycerol-3-phosphate transport system substrate-binding protein